MTAQGPTSQIPSGLPLGAPAAAPPTAPITMPAAVPISLAPPVEPELPSVMPSAGGAPPPIHPPALAASAMPEEFRQQLEELELWAIKNRNEAKRDGIAFWSLKLPAILASAGSGLLAHYQLSEFGVVLGFVASVCVIVDGIHPRGTLRSAHHRGYSDIRILSSSMMSQWRSRDKQFDAEDVARDIIRNAEKERQRIATYIRDAESAKSYRAKV